MYQNEYTSLIWAAERGHLPVVEYLVERGADMEATYDVSDVIVGVKPHTSLMNISVNVSGWIHSIDTGCQGRLFAYG